MDELLNVNLQICLNEVKVTEKLPAFQSFSLPLLPSVSMECLCA